MAGNETIKFIKRRFGLLLTGLSATTLLGAMLYLKFLHSLILRPHPVRTIEEFHQRAGARHDLLDTATAVFSASFCFLVLGVATAIIQAVLGWMRKKRNAVGSNLTDRE